MQVSKFRVLNPCAPKFELWTLNFWFQDKKKEPAASYSRAGGSRTTLGDEALDFRVRNGNGYGRLSVATGKW